jgi:hypothetical protein
MVSRTGSLTLVCGAIAALSVACGGGNNTPDTGGTDGGTDTGGGGPGGTLTYVVDQLTIDENDSETETHTGFNLDNLFSTGTGARDCSHPDFVSALDPDQNMPGTCMRPAAGCQGGVDNQLPTVAGLLMARGTDVRMLLSQQITQNSLAIIARISDVNDLMNDPAVTVRLYVGYPTFTTNCTTVAPDREYQISTSSLMPGSTNIDEAKFRLEGSIVNGRLRITSDMNTSFDLPLPAGPGQSITLALRAPQLRINISETGGTQGNLGGYVNGGDLITTLCMNQQTMSFCSLVMTAVGGLVDIDSLNLGMGMCVDTAMRRYGGIGMGLGIRTTIARVSTTPAAAQMPGTCGAATPDGGR